METWKPIPGYEDSYEASDCGHVRHVKRRVVVGTVDRGGYIRATIHHDGVSTRKTVHGLVARTFIGECPAGYEVNHKDGVKHNNTPDNLEFVTPSENHKHAYNVLKKKRMKGSKHGMAKLTETDVIAIRRMKSEGMKQHAIAKHFAVKDAMISFIVRRKNWTHI